MLMDSSARAGAAGEGAWAPFSVRTANATIRQPMADKDRIVRGAGWRMGANSNHPLQIAQAEVGRRAGGRRVSAVHELVEQVPEDSAFSWSEFGAGGGFVIRDAPPQRAQHPFTGG